MNKQNTSHHSTKKGAIIKGAINLSIAWVLWYIFYTWDQQADINKQIQLINESYCSAMWYKGTIDNPKGFITPEAEMIDLEVSPWINDFLKFVLQDWSIYTQWHNWCSPFPPDEVQKILNDCSSLDSSEIIKDEVFLDHGVNGRLHKMSCGAI